jgi:hypothetical protein
MITANLSGGLGNQMSQIVAAYALALDNNDECEFNFESIKGSQGKQAKYYRTNIYVNLKELDSAWIPETYHDEQGPGYQRIPYSQNLMIRGYFASYKYFDHHRKEIIELFGNEGDLKNSVSLHVRRGDYIPIGVKLPEIDYYNRAINYIDERKEIVNIFVFSDDLEWCKDNITDKRRIFVQQEDFEEMWIMSWCENNIIANSGFSWWGAYLNKHKDKIVISPKKWFEGYINPDLLPEEWITL